ncbi:MAG: relaxase/mobilization nuclease domain-containing protein [Janthinobacterium lividum]
MIGRTSIGGNFEGALSYGGGLGQEGASKKAELIGSSNVGDVRNPRGLAAEMQGVADDNTRCKNPVWHTSLSWAEGEHLTTTQKLQAAERYCELMGASWDAHQVVVYEHHNTKHEHIHIYLNRVPLAGGPALDTAHNYVRNLKALEIITKEMGLNPWPGQRQSVQDHRPTVQDTRTKVRAALVEALANHQVQSIEQLQERLATRGIEARLKHSQAGQLVGVSFRQGEAAVTGQEVGYKAAQLRAHYEQAQQEQAIQVEVLPLVVPPVALPVSGFTLAELPLAKLDLFGLDVAGLQASGQLQKLLNGEKTDLIAMQGGGQRDKPLVPFEGKLSLHREANSSVKLEVELSKTMIYKVIGGRSFTPEQRQRLEAKGSAGLMRDLIDAQGNRYNGYVGVDKEMKTIAILPESNVTLPDKVAGVQLSLAQRHDLREGLSVELVNTESADGSPFTSTIQIQAAKAGIETVPQVLSKKPQHAFAVSQLPVAAAQPDAPLVLPLASEPQLAVTLELKPKAQEEEDEPKQKRKGIRL